MKNVLQKKGSTLFLRAALLALGAGVLLLCTLTQPVFWSGELQSDPEYSNIAYAFYGILAALYIAAVPFYYALHQGFRLLNYIDRNKAFSLSSTKALKCIAFCAATVSIIFAASLPFFYVWAQHDDAPGLVVVGMIVTGIPLVAAVFAAVLQRLLREAIRIKSENDLTV